MNQLLFIFGSLNEQKGQSHFEQNLKAVFESLTQLLAQKEVKLQLAQQACLKHLPKIFDDVIRVFAPQQMTYVCKQVDDKVWSDGLFYMFCVFF